MKQTKAKLRGLAGRVLYHDLFPGASVEYLAVDVPVSTEAF